MKLKYRCIFLLSVFVLVVYINGNVIGLNAMNTGFSIEELAKEEQIIFVSNIDLTLLETEPEKETFICFDVNNDQLIAIGQYASNKKTICIYSSEGDFQYGYAFNCSGHFGVEWDGENLNIYFFRSSVIVSVSPNGEVLNVFEVQNTIENNSYVNHYIHATYRTSGNTEYFAQNNMGVLNLLASSYSQVIVKDVTGAERIVYDVSMMQLTKTIVTIVIISLIAIVVIANIAWQFIKLKLSR